MGRVILTRRPFYVRDIEHEETVPALSRQMIEALGTRSQLTIPMLRAGEPIGAITMGWDEPEAFDDQQVALLQTFADQAVIAIENVRLFNETKEALERQTATAEILKVIASSPSNVQPVFDAIVQSAARLFGRRAGLRVVEGNVLRRMARSDARFGGIRRREVLPIDRDSSGRDRSPWTAEGCRWRTRVRRTLRRTCALMPTNWISVKRDGAPGSRGCGDRRRFRCPLRTLGRFQPRKWHYSSPSPTRR